MPARVTVVEGRPVRVTTDRRGFAGGTVLRSAGPWRTSGAWWEDQAGGAGQAGSGENGRSLQPIPPVQPWNRDEWDVSLSDGAVYRVFVDRDTDRWFIDAIFD